MHNRFFKGLALALTVATVMTSAMPVMADEIVEEVTEEAVEVAETISQDDVDKFVAENGTVSENFKATETAIKDKANKNADKKLTYVKNSPKDTVSVGQVIQKGKVKALEVKLTASTNAVTLVGGSKVKFVGLSENNVLELKDAANCKKFAKMKKGVLTLKADKKAEKVETVTIEAKDGDKVVATCVVTIQNVTLTGNKTVLYTVSGNVDKDGKTVSINTAAQKATVSLNLVTGKNKSSHDADFISAVWNIKVAKSLEGKVKAEFDDFNQTAYITAADGAKGAATVECNINGKIFKSKIKIADKLPKKAGKIINPQF